jgi:hypothetical protein
MRGRYPSGPEAVERLPGSAEAKERLQVVLETMAGRCRVQEACARLGISEPRFQQLQQQMLSAALDSLEARPAGRPRRADAEARVQVLEGRVADLEIELRAARTREEIALILPQVPKTPPPTAAPKKASRRRPSSRRRRRNA